MCSIFKDQGCSQKQLHLVIGLLTNVGVRRDNRWWFEVAHSCDQSLLYKSMFVWLIPANYWPGMCNTLYRWPGCMAVCTGSVLQGILKMLLCKRGLQHVLFLFPFNELRAERPAALIREKWVISSSFVWSHLVHHRHKMRKTLSGPFF